MATPCELVLPYRELDQQCAKVLVFPYGNRLIRSLPLQENHQKVLIDDINSRYENFYVLVMTKEVSNLQGAVGTVIQWSRIAIILAKVQMDYPLLFKDSSFNGSDMYEQMCFLEPL
ncbi:unnamed protein product [Lactuca virosa]|uniref:DUF8039 domain-containing protein n=1 Tax=Lactuca virosa TaxID=75947 RepID=A0AAU9N279_9ASTR|nr:unnamed protein product [Lactuca virosa]